MTPQDYEAWLAGGRVDRHRRSQNGERLFTDATRASRATRRTRPAAARRCTACSAARCSWPTAATVVADENYLRESIMNPQAKVVQGYQPHHAGVPGHGERREPAAAHRLHQDAEAGGGRGAGGALARVLYERPILQHTQQLSRRAVRRRVVAPDQGPQAHRDAVPDLDHDLLRGRRHVRRRHPPRAADAEGRPVDAGHCTTSSSRCTAW